MKTRFFIVLAFLFGSFVSLYLVYFGKLSQDTSGILANLGTGFIGTILTVLIVDWLYERRSADEQCRTIAFSVLLEFDHAIWVWQGDSRAFNIDEMFTRIVNAEINDPIPPFTQNLFMKLGTRSVSQLNLKSEDLSRRPKLVSALKKLSKLELIRDNQFSFLELKEVLLSTVPLLAVECAISEPQVIQIQPTAHRLSSVEHQHYRHYGRQIDGSEQPLWGGGI